MGTPRTIRSALWNRDDNSLIFSHVAVSTGVIGSPETPLYLALIASKSNSGRRSCQISNVSTKRFPARSLYSERNASTMAADADFSFRGEATMFKTCISTSFKLTTVVDPSRLPLLLRRFRLACIKAGCRQDWRVDEPLRQLPGETREKSDDVGSILIAESPSELHLGHDSHRLRKRANRAVMEIRGRHRDVAQTRHLEHVSVLRIVRHVEAAFVRLLAPRRGPIILDDAELLEDAAAAVRAVVAGGAPGIDEFAQPGALLRRERPSIAREKGVESGRRHECALERADRLGPVIRRDRVRILG